MDANCPACLCPDNIWIGMLGQRAHVRCRDCGMDYSYIVEEDADEEDTDKPEWDGQPDELQEWHDFDPDC